VNEANTRTDRIHIRILQAVVVVTFGLAVSAAVLLLTLRAIHSFRPDIIPWTLKSGVPLMLAGAAFAGLQFAISRTRAQIVLGLMVAAAFILWGAEQFLPNPAIAAFIDDLVVFLFVVDLSLVTFGHLKAKSPAD